MAPGANIYYIFFNYSTYERKRNKFQDRHSSLEYDQKDYRKAYVSCQGNRIGSISKHIEND